MIIAVDFDGTIVEHAYPKIGRELPFAVDSLKMLQDEGIRLILWTSRYGELLDDAVNYCKARGLEFYAVNRNFPEEQFDSNVSRKIVADIYIDDRNFGGLPGWGEIYQQISQKDKSPTSKSFLKWLKS